MNLPSMLFPRFSPDGSRIAYAAVNPDAADAEPGRRSGWRWFWQPRAAAAHGLPMDVWLIPADGGPPQRLTHLAEDEPAPAWSPDGAQMAVMATGGLYQVSVATGEARTIGPGAFGGQADWR
jgi:Tol biopolymer transport system component